MMEGQDEVAKVGGDTITDILRYIRTGEFTPSMYLATMSEPRVLNPPEPCDQPDGFGTNTE